MKTYKISQALAFIALLALATGCGSGKGFSNRKYTAGNYISHKHKAGRPTVNEAEKSEAVALANAEEAKEKAATAGSVAANRLSGKTVEEQGATALGMAPVPQKQATEKSKRWKEAVASAREKKEQVIARFVPNKVERKALASDEGDKSLDSIALIGFIMGVLGLGINLFAFSAIVGAAAYFLAILFIAGLVLGILGVVFGSQGIRRHHKNNGSTISLVFSIIGTACGGVAIITAFIFSIATLFIYLASV